MWLLAQTSSSDLPVNLTALGLLALVVVFFLRRTDRQDTERREDVSTLSGENAALRAQVDAVQAENLVQRRLKHESLNNLAASLGTLQLVKRLAEDCTCGAMSRIEPVIDSVLDRGNP